MGTTNKFGFRYPEPTDSPDGAAQIQALAEDVEGTLSPWGLVVPINWTNLTATGTGISVRNRLRVKRHATGQIEFQVSINIGTGTTSNGQVFCTLPSWAAFPGADLLIPMATNNTAGTKAYFSTGSDGKCTLALSAVTTDSGRFCEGVFVWST